MIIAEQKPLEEIEATVRPYKKILIVGCGTCVTVCFAGGAKEVGLLAATLRIKSKMNGQEQEFQEATVQRQCEWEFLDPLEEQVKQADLVLSLGCGVGVQAIAERFPQARVAPGLNTSFLGLPVVPGAWEARCAACGDCVLARTGGICPIVRCSKGILNGPCGGSVNGRCEVDPQIPCGWQLIYDRLEALGILDALEEIIPPKNWRLQFGQGSRRIAREELMAQEEAKV